MPRADKDSQREYDRAYDAAHREKIREYNRKYYATHKGKEYRRKYYQEHKDELNKKSVIWKKEHPEQAAATTKRWHDKVKAELFEHYGNKCACCGETRDVFLCIHHTDGGGGKHRSEVGKSLQFYRWLIKNNFPGGYEALCYNCHAARHILGKCPHKGD